MCLVQPTVGRLHDTVRNVEAADATYHSATVLRAPFLVVRIQELCWTLPCPDHDYHVIERGQLLKRCIYFRNLRCADALSSPRSRFR